MNGENMQPDKLEEMVSQCLCRLESRRIDERLALSSEPSEAERLRYSRTLICVRSIPVPRSEEDAFRMAQIEEWDENVKRTGLRKICPRCKRGGWCFIIHSRGLIQPCVLVVWDGPGRGGVPRANMDNFTLEEAFRPTYGCGYDGFK